MDELKKITNLIPGDVVIEDLGIRLRGLGDSFIVSTNIAHSSTDLVNNSRFIKIEPFKIENNMSLWPFIKESKHNEEILHSNVQSNDIETIKNQIDNIESGLQILLSRPQSVTSEIVAEHIQKYQLTHCIIPDQQNMWSDPVFIPSNIVPVNTDSSIKIKKDAIKVDDFNTNLDALRRVRKGK